MVNEIERARQSKPVEKKKDNIDDDKLKRNVCIDRARKREREKK